MKKKSEEKRKSGFKNKENKEKNIQKINGRGRGRRIL